MQELRLQKIVNTKVTAKARRNIKSRLEKYNAIGL